jgi:hypothetical protein
MQKTLKLPFKINLTIEIRKFTRAVIIFLPLIAIDFYTKEFLMVWVFWRVSFSTKKNQSFC